MFADLPPAEISAPSALQGTYECRAKPGEYESREIPANGTHWSVSGQVRMIAEGRGSDWEPAAGVLFRLPDDKFIGFQLFVSRARPERFSIGFRRPGSEYPRVFASAPLSALLTFSIKLTEDDAVLMTVGGVTKKLRGLRTAPVGGMLMCSSGDFDFTSLQALPIQSGKDIEKR